MWLINIVAHERARLDCDSALVLTQSANPPTTLLVQLWRRLAPCNGLHTTSKLVAKQASQFAQSSTVFSQVSTRKDGPCLRDEQRASTRNAVDYRVETHTIKASGGMIAHHTSRLPTIDYRKVVEHELPECRIKRRCGVSKFPIIEDDLNDRRLYFKHCQRHKRV